MRYSPEQNPSNLVGRNSGAGPGGVTQVVPTAREAERGLKPIRLEEGGRRWMRPLGMGLGALALVGAGALGYVMRQRRQPSGLRGRMEKLVKHF